jgi:hypothetical protein
MRRLALLLALLAGSASAADLPRDQIVLRSAISVDAEANRVTLPLFRGEAGGKTVWYIVTDSSDAADAAARGVVHAPLLARAGHVQRVTWRRGELRFTAAPDFAVRRQVQAGPQGYPPQLAFPGGSAPPAYSPFIRLAVNGPVLNAPIVATGDGPFDLAGHSDLQDRVLAIDTLRRTVTLLLSHGFAEGRRVVYISTEASDAGVAALERAIHVPQLGEGEADIALLAVVNGGDAQGLQQFLRLGRADVRATLADAPGLGSPLNILTAFPLGRTASGYSPLWSVSKLEWRDTAGAVQRHQNDIYALASAKRIAEPQPTGITVNCPVIAWIDGAVP